MKNSFKSHKDKEAIINLKVDSNTDIYSSYCLKKDLVLNDEVAGYLERNALGAHLVKIEIRLFGEVNENEFACALKNYYKDKFNTIKREIKQNLIISIVFTVLSILIFSLLIILNKNNSSFVLIEIIEITGWVFMWEAVDNFFIQRKKLQFEQLKDIRLMTSKITSMGINNEQVFL